MKWVGCINLNTGVFSGRAEGFSREGDQDRINHWLTKGFIALDTAVLLRDPPKRWVVVYHTAEQCVYRTKNAAIMATLLLRLDNDT